jgi:hypothetical protein
MPSLDYIEDARDALHAGDMPHILLCAVQDGDCRCFRSANVGGKEQLEWFKRRFDEWYEDLSKQFNANNS